MTPNRGDTVIDAQGGALLPGLHDHHLHLLSLAASLESLHCGPPQIDSEAGLIELLSRHNRSGKQGWIRAIGYHACVAGDIDRYWLDLHIPERPIRVQHRGGRLWVLNSCALRALGENALAGAPDGLEQVEGEYTGRLYEGDRWLREQLNSQMPSLDRASRLLASYGITGVTDTTPHNGAQEWEFFQRSRRQGELRQNIRVMGSQALDGYTSSAMQHLGEYKIHLMESWLPDFDELCDDINRAHLCERNVAIHCVTFAELLFSLNALERAGVLCGDRIEHAAITPPRQLEQMAAMGLRVVTQPNFVAERGEQYLQDVDPDELAWLYRCRSFLDAGVALAAGSDAPFGNPDPWFSMRAAVARTTAQGGKVGCNERLSPEQALGLFLAPLDSPGLQPRTLVEESAADLCLLDCPWSKARSSLDQRHVKMTWCAGEVSYIKEAMYGF